jgi:cytochrome d ubiquinol oxidase subunit II
MHLQDLPLVAMVIGLAAYAVLAGADFGAGFWHLAAGRGPRAGELREAARHAIAAVWEANHVWLIFVITVCWTAYPAAFGSIASTLVVPLFVAAVGIILRGGSYAVGGYANTARERRIVGRCFEASSLLTPFALGLAVGGIASGRVPLGNAQGDLVTSWLNPTSIAIGVLAVVTAAFVAAVFLAADARRTHHDLVQPFRARALVMGVVAGAAAVAGLAVIHSDAPALWNGFGHPLALAAIAVSAAAGIATFALVLTSRFGPARVTAGVAVSAVVIGWPLAQRPDLLPGVTISEAAAGRATLVGLVISILAGALVLFPSLAYLFRLVLRGAFDPDAGEEPAPGAGTGSHRGPSGRLAAICLTLGLAAATVIAVTTAGLLLAISLTVLLLAAAAAFVATASRVVILDGDSPRTEPPGGQSPSTHSPGTIKPG